MVKTAFGCIKILVLTDGCSGAVDLLSLHRSTRTDPNGAKKVGSGQSFAPKGLENLAQG
jgi:hypothetical protein